MSEQSNKKMGKWTRRAFIGTGVVAGAGLLIGVGGNAYVSRSIRKYSGRGMGDGSSLNAWIRISPENEVTIAVPRAEMGQGVYTSLPQLVAEELEVDFDQIKVVHPQPESPYANTFILTQEEPNIFKSYSMGEKMAAFLPVIGTGGSTSIIDGYNNMRYAGATAREMLKQAAADKWGVKPGQCKAENGYIIHTGNQEKLFYGELAEAAAKVELKELPKLKDKKDFKVIRQPKKRLDVPEKVTGAAKFGIDARPEGMLFAAIRCSSVVKGKITKVTNEEEILKMRGVKKVVITESGPAIVIADNTWRAINAARSLKVEEEKGENANLSSAAIKETMDKLMKKAPIATPRNDGDVKTAFAAEGGKVIEADYNLPYLAHATMEPMNCTVKIENGKAEAWLGHQASSVVHNIVSEVSGIPKKDVKINIMYMGGGFGRRGEPDYVRLATEAAVAMKGTAVQTVYTREEDMMNDMYRPVATSSFKGKVNANGDIEAWDNMMVLQSTANDAMKRIMPAMATSPKDDETTAEGASDLVYKMPNYRVAFGDLKVPVSIGFWRSVGYSQNTFFAESFMDEMAHAAGEDPYLFRKKHLKAHPRFEACLDKVAEMSGWDKPTEEGRFRGIAIAKSYGSIAAEVAEIVQVGEKEFKIDKYFCAIDCGNYVNPAIIEQQVQSAIVFGLTAALYGEITFSDGSVDQMNFPQYDMIRLKECPDIKVHIMEVDDYPGGVGEPGTPPAAPALTNAIFAATGQRLRTLPLKKQGYKFV